MFRGDDVFEAIVDANQCNFGRAMCVEQNVNYFFRFWWTFFWTIANIFNPMVFVFNSTANAICHLHTKDEMKNYWTIGRFMIGK